MTRTLQEVIESEQELTAEEKAWVEARMAEHRKALLEAFMNTPGPRSGYAMMLLHGPRTIEQARQLWREVQPYKLQLQKLDVQAMREAAQETIKRVFGS